MSHSQFHCTGRAYLDMHGLIFETSICYWQDQPGRSACERSLTARGRGGRGGGGGGGGGRDGEEEEKEGEEERGRAGPRTGKEARGLGPQDGRTQTPPYPTNRATTRHTSLAPFSPFLSPTSFQHTQPPPPPPPPPTHTPSAAGVGRAVARQTGPLRARVWRGERDDDLRRESAGATISPKRPPP